jgi:hypothetical protein
MPLLFGTLEAVACKEIAISSLEMKGDVAT